MTPDRLSAKWIVNTCGYVVVDGHHRLTAIEDAKKKGLLKDLVRVLFQTPLLCAQLYKWQRLNQMYFQIGDNDLQVDCCVMHPLAIVEQFVFSERANETVLNNNVELTVWDRISQINQLRELRQDEY